MSDKSLGCAIEQTVSFDTNRDALREALAEAYRDLFANSPEYAYAAQRYTPESLAAKMIGAGPRFAGNKDGDGVRRACKALGIKHTYTAINAYLSR